ncbi:hypothetical protein, partial [Candidatus Cardinium sp. cBcalN1]|uniref:hypothetical protein n=1 Tax=Candidatus Cardinium sp. cBcalN1 TaxID=2699437 RepID=UPI001FB33AC1
KTIILLGINFNEETRMIDNWDYEIYEEYLIPFTPMAYARKKTRSLKKVRSESGVYKGFFILLFS